MKPDPHLIVHLTLILLLTQPKPIKPDPSDTLCLTQLYESFLNPTLTNWSKPFFSNPCYNGFDSYMVGLTCNNGRVFRLSLPNSNLRGSISPSVTKCSNLQTLDFSSNSLSGEIPDLKDLSNLAILNLSVNRLTGSIPGSLYLCTYLNVIDLHGNRLTGSIPGQLGLLGRLSRFNVADNELSGLIPASLGNRSGNLVRFNASDFRGNKGLFGYPLDAYRGGGSGGGFSVMAIVGIGLGSGLLSLVVSFSIVCVWLRVSERKLVEAEEAKISHLMPHY